MQPADVLPEWARRIAVVDGQHWILQPAQDRRARGSLGARNSRGYALVSAGPGKKGQSVLLSRVVLTRAVRPPQPGEQACHDDAKCRIRHCFSPYCLYWAPAAENARAAHRMQAANRAARRGGP